MVKIAVVGTGYVGLSNAVLLAQHNQVVALDIVPEKVDLLNDRLSPIEDALISDFLANLPLNLRATLDRELALGDAQCVIIATPTDYNPDTNCFDTSSGESVDADVLAVTPSRAMVSKSDVQG